MDIKLVRTAEIDHGRVTLEFHATVGNSSEPLWFKMGDDGAELIPPHTLNKVFPSLSDEEMSRAFGPLTGVRVEYLRKFHTAVSKEEIKDLSEKVAMWWENGFRKCQTLQQQKSLDGWLYKRAVWNPACKRWDQLK